MDAGWDEGELQGSVPERFERMVRRHPQRLALKDEATVLTYDALNRQVNRLADAILQQTGPGSQPVALMFEHGAAFLIAILASLKAGKFYVPLDVSTPAGRLKLILEDARPPLLLTNDRNLAKAGELADEALCILNVDHLPPGLSEQNPELDIPGEAYFNVVYTSGSTGRPKGVIQNHRNIVRRAYDSQQIESILPDDRVSLLLSPSFGASVADFMCGWLIGAAVFPFDLKTHGLLPLGPWLREERITVYHSVPTVFRHFLSTLKPGDTFPDMRIIKLGGEPVYKRDAELFQRHFPATCYLRTTLGSTEAGAATWYRVDAGQAVEDPILPLGYPARNVSIELWDEDGQPVAPGQVGEIVITSEQCSPGYFNLPELTAEKFLPVAPGSSLRRYRTGDLGRWRADGCLEYAGRLDLQVKVRGHRIDLAEIETRLLEHPGVANAVVVARQAANGDQGLIADQHLVAYLIPAHIPAPKPAELLALLREQLPDYMLPARFVYMDQFPLLPFGKVNRFALPAPDDLDPRVGFSPQDALPENGIAPQGVPDPQVGGLEAALAGIWARVLGRSQVGVDQNFFELGGNSLLASQVVFQIREQLGDELPLSALFQAPTVRQLARAVAAGRGGDPLQATRPQVLPPEELERALRLLGLTTDS